MLAFIGNIDSFEVVVILGAALLVFGKDLPRVIIRGLAHLTRLRRQLNDLWRQAGIEEELRKMKREVEQDMPNPNSLWREELDRARSATAEIREADPRTAISEAINAEDGAPHEDSQDPGEHDLYHNSGHDFGHELDPNEHYGEAGYDPEPYTPDDLGSSEDHGAPDDLGRPEDSSPDAASDALIDDRREPVDTSGPATSDDSGDAAGEDARSA